MYLRVRIKKLHPDAKIPKYSKEGDAGLDITATSIITDAVDKITYGTGLSLEIPEGYVGLIYPRSSIRNTELVLSNSVGVIDSGYRGELQATFNKLTGRYAKSYSVGERIMQIIIVPYPRVLFEEVEELSDTARGTGGFGSTGKK